LALRRPGIGSDAVASLPPAEALESHGTASSLEIFFAPDASSAITTTADVLLARAGADIDRLCEVFQLTLPPVRCVLTSRPHAVPAAHDNQVVYCGVAPAAAQRPRAALYTCYLLATQLVEILAHQQSAGWDGHCAHGEALSRVLAARLYPGCALAFATASTWLDGPREDAVNRRVDGDDDMAAVGCSALFLNYLHFELDHSWRRIVQAGAPTLAVTYRRLTGVSDDPFSRFRQSLDAIADVDASREGDNPYPLTARAGRSDERLESAGAGPAVAVRSRPAATALCDALAHRRWWRVETPFRHLRAEDVFRAEVYDNLVATFRERLDAGHLTRNLPGYDASAAAVTADNAGGFAVFLTREWHDALAGSLGVRGTGEVIATLHHHAPGSASGTIHNDLNPGWFPAERTDERITVHDPAVNNYRTGASPSGIPTVQRIRAVAMLYYFDTPTDVDGGGTGLFGSSHAALDSPDIVVPPKNNSLVAFECTPYSFHTFLSNRHRSRNCLAMWLHQDRREVVARWGAGSIVGWS
jgi:hypothetical protein